MLIYKSNKIHFQLFDSNLTIHNIFPVDMIMHVIHDIHANCENFWNVNFQSSILFKFAKLSQEDNYRMKKGTSFVFNTLYQCNIHFFTLPNIILFTDIIKMNRKKQGNTNMNFIQFWLNWNRMKKGKKMIKIFSSFSSKFRVNSMSWNVKLFPTLSHHVYQHWARNVELFSGKK